MTEKKQRVAVGMSGGVDSSAAAALLVEQGYEVVGVTAHMWSASRCCSIEDVQRAANVCKAMGIPHHVVNAVEEFGKEIIEPFVEEYASGRTPSPCIHCNEYIKFGIAMQKALELDCDFFATGHYARVEKRDDGYHLCRGLDRSKDQSYFLHRLSQEQLAHTLLPLGEREKSEITQYVKEQQIPVIFRGESQDLCFVPDDGHPAFVERYRRDLKKKGPILDPSGKKLGEHEGFHRYTIGQRQGLGVASTERLYVKELRAAENTVVLASRGEIMSDQCAVEHVHWISGTAPVGPIQCDTRVRYRHEGATSTVTPLDNGSARVTFEEKQFAITPGQAAVFYDGDEVLGGGWIADRKHR